MLVYSSFPLCLLFSLPLSDSSHDDENEVPGAFFTVPLPPKPFRPSDLIEGDLLPTDFAKELNELAIKDQKLNPPRDLVTRKTPTGGSTKVTAGQNKQRGRRGIINPKYKQALGDLRLWPNGVVPFHFHESLRNGGYRLLFVVYSSIQFYF